MQAVIEQRTGAMSAIHGTAGRIPRFAELDAQIQAEVQVRRNRPKAKPERRRRSTPRLPAALRKEIARFARELTRNHRPLFKPDPKLKDRASRLLRSLLLPSGDVGALECRALRRPLLC